MSSVMPSGESVRRAIKWVSQELEANPGASIADLVNEASLRFDLTPPEQNFLLKFFLESRQKEKDE